jgi:hypothetical protein
MRDSIDRYKR